MVKMVWLLKQPFSCFVCFKIRARLGLRLVGCLGAITMLGRSAPLHWSRVHTLLCVAGHGYLWPGYGPTAAGPAVPSCCRPPHAMTLSLPSHRRCIHALLPCRTIDPPHAMTLPLLSHRHRVRAYRLYPLHRCRPSSRPPLPCTRGRAHRHLVI